MNTKILTFLFAIILLTGFTLALTQVTSPPSSLIFTEENQVRNFTIANDNSESINLNYSTIPSITEGGDVATFSVNGPSSINAGNSANIQVTLSGNPQDFDFGTRKTSLTVTAINETNSSDFIKFDKIDLVIASSFCTAGSVSTIEGIDVDDIRIRVEIDNRGEGDDDKWELFDEIEIEVTVDNNADEDFDDAIVELGLYDENGRNVARNLDFLGSDDEEIDVGRIRDGDDAEVLFHFRVPADFDTGSYNLAVKVYSDDEGEKNLCVDTSEDLDNDGLFTEIDIVEVDDEGRFVVVDDIIVDEQATCGDVVQGRFTVFNIGDEDQERVLITLQNNDLDLEQTFEITRDLDIGEDQSFDFNFRIPNNAEDKLYALEFFTEYDYRNGVYRERSDDTFVGFVEVIGCKITPTDSLVITGTLSSGAIAGETMTVTSTITNINSPSSIFFVEAAGYQSWAALNSISERTLTINKGQSRTINLDFTLNEDIQGEQTFFIEVRDAEGNLQTREVRVNVESPATNGGVSFDEIFRGNTLIWVIGAINLILIILIIIVAVRVSRS